MADEVKGRREIVLCWYFQIDLKVNTESVKDKTKFVMCDGGRIDKSGLRGLAKLLSWQALEEANPNLERDWKIKLLVGFIYILLFEI